MSIKLFLKLGVIAILFALVGCGSGDGGEGLNGSVELSTSVSGSFITATATYKHPTRTDLIGIPISFSYFDGASEIPIKTVNTNNSGSVALTFQVAPFAGTKDIVVIAKSDNLSGISIVSMTGATFTMTPPASPTAVTADGTVPLGSTAQFTLNALNFVTIKDPFFNDISGHTISTVATLAPQAPSDSIAPNPTTAITSPTGVAQLSGVTVTLAIPDTVSTRTVTVTWVATDLVTGYQAAGTTTLTVTRTALPTVP